MEPHLHRDNVNVIMTCAYWGLSKAKNYSPQISKLKI